MLNRWSLTITFNFVCSLDGKWFKNKNVLFTYPVYNIQIHFNFTATTVKKQLQMYQM